MSNEPTQVFVLGAAGYIGGAALIGYKKAFPKFQYTALIRNKDYVPAFEAIGAKTVIGDHSELDKITDLVGRADIVLNAADADDLPLTKAVLNGLKRRNALGDLKPILIHTSGTGVATDHAEGEYRDEKPLYNDNNPADIKAISEDAPHRLVDLEIFKADEEGYVSAYIIAPSTIYGIGDGPVRTISQQIPALIKKALESRKPIQIGPGTAIWNNVHIKDLVELYILVLDRALRIKEKEDPFTKFYWGSNEQIHVWGDLVREIGKILYAQHKVDTAEPVSISNPGGGFGSTGTNSKTRADRGFALGWKPVQPSVIATLPEDIDAVLANKL